MSADSRTGDAHAAAAAATSATGAAPASGSARWSQTLIPTQKNDPADATLASHKLMVRGGFVRQLQAGVYDFLPLGWRSLHKVMTILRQEMNRAGAAECFLPVLQPIDLWDKTGRNAIYGDDMLRATDRHGRVNALAPTHEECITELIAAYVSSYKQLPLILYQIQTKFRDEPRPRSGLLRVREFFMKDAYSFDATPEGLDESYRRMYAAYERIYQRCGIPALPVEAESGPIGGSASHEFTVPCDAGEDIILTSDRGNYAANVEKAETGDRAHDLGGAPTGELERVHTPGMSTIEDVGKFMKVKPKNMLKSLVFQASSADGTETALVLAVVRGDHDVNEAKVAAAARGQLDWASSVKLLDDVAREQWGPKEALPIGFIGPARTTTPLAFHLILADPDAAQGGFWATGANEVDHHVKHFNWQRDLLGVIEGDPEIGFHVADIRNAVAGDPSPKNDGGVLRASRGVEVGHVFKLGTRYSALLGANFLDEQNRSHPVLMGCYGIGVGRILISAVETGHDDRGIIWPAAIAPYSVVITPIKYEAEMKDAADRIFAELDAAGVDVLLDDRDDRPGSKFADADLIGIPVRITVGDRGLKNGVVEVKVRKTGETLEVPLAEAAAKARELLAGL